jgi:short-subunit dehydrogenase
MANQIHDSVVVITGASSGIGRATALEFAWNGANVVLAARREQLLAKVADECKQLNGREALVVPTDVAEEDAVQNLAHQAYEHFGHIDCWINNAGVGAYGRFEELPADVFRQVIETNFCGTTYGARAVIPYFRRQGHGVLINNASMLAAVSAPYYSAYASSKFAIRALSESLRQELEGLEGTDIHICTVMPATIDTPFFRHAANFTGRAVKALPPVYAPELVAQTMLSLAKRPRRETFVGSAARMIGFMHYYMPMLAEPIVARQVDMLHFKEEDSPSTSGSVLTPMQEGTGASDGWGGARKQAKRSIIGTSVAVIASALLAWAWFKGRS